LNRPLTPTRKPAATRTLAPKSAVPPARVNPQRANGVAHASGQPRLPLALPEPGLHLDQDAEWFLVKLDGEWRQIRFHDYGAIYNVPGLYERIFYDILKCKSPEVLSEALAHALEEAGVNPRELRVLDLGAGNGMVGERLRALGASRLIGADILPEAAAATRRDRPSVYDAYRVLDFMNLSPAERDALVQERLNCLTCVAALGFGDIPAAAFLAAFDLVERDGWIAFTIKDSFVQDRSGSEFAELIHSLESDGRLRIVCRQRYQHRLSTGGVPLYYVCFIGRKQEPAIP